MSKDFSTRRSAELLVHESACCMGYANACVCARCVDRGLRFKVYTNEGRPHAASEAERDSTDYFKTPWRFDASSPPRRLKD